MLRIYYRHMSCIAPVAADPYGGSSHDFICRQSEPAEPAGPDLRAVEVQIFVGIGEFIELFNGQIHGYKIMPDIWSGGRELLLEMSKDWVISHVYHQYAETRWVRGDNYDTWCKNTPIGWVRITQSICPMNQLMPTPLPLAAPSSAHHRPPRSQRQGPYRQTHIQEQAAIPLVNINDIEYSMKGSPRVPNGPQCGSQPSASIRKRMQTLASW